MSSGVVSSTIGSQSNMALVGVNKSNNSYSSHPNIATIVIPVIKTLQTHPLAFTEGNIDGTNFTMWKLKITSILDSYEMLEIVLRGADEEPQETPDPNNPNAMISPILDLLCAWKHKNVVHSML